MIFFLVPADSDDVDFGKRCEFCCNFFLRADMYAHQKSCNKRRLNRKSKVKPRNLMEELNSGASTSQTPLVAENNIPLVVDLPEDSTRTLEDQATNPPFTQGSPNIAIELITISDGDNIQGKSIKILI
jgi:hypothetical protein